MHTSRLLWCWARSLLAMGFVACSSGDTVTSTSSTDAPTAPSRASDPPLGMPAGATTPIPDMPPHDWNVEVTKSVHDALLADIDSMLAALKDIQAAAPTPASRGWSAALDRAQLDDMRNAWLRARSAYERVEGAVAPRFPYIDAPLDARYDHFLSVLGPAGDADPFDGEGVTGMHAIERILYAESTPQHVVAFEATLPGYRAARIPASADEALAFKDGLCARAIKDATLLRAQWDDAHLDASIAFEGLVDLMIEQREKVNKASSSEEESRYSQRTMADLRDNLDGTRRVYALFSPWIRAHEDGTAVDESIFKGLDALGAQYMQVPTAAIPMPPSTWSAENPSAEDLASPFGVLFGAVQAAVDPNGKDNVTANMTRAATMLGFVHEGE